MTIIANLLLEYYLPGCLVLYNGLDTLITDAQCRFCQSTTSSEFSLNFRTSIIHYMASCNMCIKLLLPGDAQAYQQRFVTTLHVLAACCQQCVELELLHCGSLFPCMVFLHELDP